MNSPKLALSIEKLRQTLRKRSLLCDAPDGLMPSAVLIPIVGRVPSPTILFIKRSEQTSHHKGQVSFPGGAFDSSQDQTLMDTALRETEEETGVASSNIELLGPLSPYSTISGFWLVPFVGWVRNPPPMYNLSQTEVTRVFEVPITFFQDPRVYEIREIEYLDEVRLIHYFYYEDEVIWGATAHILVEFLRLSS